MDGIFRDVDLALIEYTSPSGRGILYLVEIANDATEHMRKDFVAGKRTGKARRGQSEGTFVPETTGAHAP